MNAAETAPTIPQECTRLLSFGFSIFPVRRRGKEPLTKRGFKDATRVPAQIAEWVRKWPGCNWGVALGASSGCFVLDFDTKDGHTKFEREHGKLPPTYIVRTKRGAHLYFPLPKSGAATRKFDGGELRSDGAYVVAEGSIHPSDALYECMSDMPIAEFPPALLAHFRPRPNIEARPDAPIPEGQRNAALASLAGTMRRRGACRAAIAAALREENTARCTPPLPDREVTKIATSVAGYAPAADLPSPRPSGGNLPEWKPVEPDKKVGAVTRCFADIVPKPIQWLWPGRIPLGKLTLLIGDPGLGKSLVTLDIAARVSRGLGFPDVAASVEGAVIFLSAEDDCEDTIRPRLDAAGADVSRVHILEAVRVLLADGDATERGFNLEADLSALEDALARIPGVRLVVIDPVSAYLGETDSHTNAKVRALLAPLAALAARRGVAIVAITHFRKSGGPAVHRAIESIAFVAAARAAWAVAPDPDDRERRLMLPVKQNLAANVGGLSFRVNAPDGTARLEWEEGAVKLDVNEVLGDFANSEDRSARQEAQSWLTDLLADGPLPAKKIRVEADAAGLPWITVRRAKADLGILVSKDGYVGGWSWRLPAAEDAHEPPKALTSETRASSANLSAFDERESASVSQGGPGLTKSLEESNCSQASREKETGTRAKPVVVGEI